MHAYTLARCLSERKKLLADFEEFRIFGAGVALDIEGDARAVVLLEAMEVTVRRLREMIVTESQSRRRAPSREPTSKNAAQRQHPLALRPHDPAPLFRRPD